MNLKYIALAAGILAAGPAFAQVTQTDGVTNLYTGGAPAYGSTVFTETFETGTASSRFSSATANPLVVTSTSVGGQYSKPFNDTSTYYAAVQSSPNNSPVTLNLTGLGSFNQISFYWGSQDSYNVLSFLSGSTVVASFTGGAGQAGAESAYETYLIAPSAVGTITGLRFESIGNNAFEFDNVVVGNAVPEPASWALMIAGVGMIGGALRRRDRKNVSVKFATA